MNSSSLIKFVCEKNYQAIKQLLIQKPTSVLETDEHGNTALHHAVAQGDLQAIKLLLMSPDLKPRCNNKYGENALEWYQKYADLSSCFAGDFFNNLTLYSNIFATNDRIHVAMIHDRLEESPFLTMRLPKGDNILHLAIRYSQFSIVKLILRKFNDQNCYCLLHGKNFIGETPLELAQKLQRQGISEVQNIVSLVQQKMQKIPNSLNCSLTVNELPEVTLNLYEISQLRQYLNKKITKEDLPSIKALLPSLVSLCYFTCCLTLLQCNEMLRDINQNGRKHKTSRESFYMDNLTFALRKQFKWLLRVFLGRSDKEIVTHLKEQTLRTAIYLANVIVQQKAHQFIELEDITLTSSVQKIKSLSASKRWAYSSYEGKKVTYNITNSRHDLLNSTTTILHETTHLALHSFDAFYYAVPDNRCGAICLPMMDNIAQEFEFNSPIQKELFNLQFQLENKGHDKENWVQWVCKNNADSLSYCVTYLAANYSDLIEVEDDLDGKYEAIIKINDHFLSNEHIKYFTAIKKEPDQLILKPAELLARERDIEKDTSFARHNFNCFDVVSMDENAAKQLTMCLEQRMSSLTIQDNDNFALNGLLTQQTNTPHIVLLQMLSERLTAL